MSDDIDLKDLTDRTLEFMETPLGKHYTNVLQIKYNALHQEAESQELSIERKAMLIERAAGLKIAIDFFTSAQMLKGSAYLKD